VNYHSGDAPDHLSSWRTAVRTLRWADAIVVQSPFLAQVFARFGLNVDVIPNHVDPDLLPFRERRPLQPLFLSTRALEPSYDVATVLNAFGTIQQQFPEAELKIVGDGSSREALEELSQELRLRGVTFTGAVDVARLADVYDGSDVFLNASTVDSMPLSLLEAFASGLPVVSTAAGGIPDLVKNEETGLLVPLRDPGSLAAAAIRLLREPDLSSRLAAAARAECSKYSWSATRPSWVALYDRLAA
jgi:glycosyltransferase involved in cell wall biosynthesis